LSPDRRASDKPIAMACLRLFTFFPDLPLRNVPDLRSCNALPTFVLLARLYLRAMGSSAMKLASSARLGSLTVGAPPFALSDFN
jgi:hypothetical protein